MLPVSEELKEKLKKVNTSLKAAYPASAFNEQRIREKLEQVGTFYQIEKWEEGKLKEWLKGQTLVGVDGSVNSIRGTQMRTLSVFQALAKGTQGEEKWAAEVYTPLLEGDGEPEEGQEAREARKRGAILSHLEMEVAEQAIAEWAPGVVMLDGSLLHFHIENPNKWKGVAQTAERNESLLIGVSEEIGTRGLARELFPEYPVWSDRDLLYGVLRVGEAFEWQGWSPSGSGMWKMVFRPSNHPQPIGVDGLASQYEVRLDLLRLVYSLTPEQGRGIPFWLDIVDNQVRVTDGLVQMMVDQYIDPELRHRLLIPKRSERVI
ncbi:DNA double-strand break repair nuclease NurA [Lihuaxuella thermophila]|uniref:NurA domain-containing protein n=1 Tax=Lihuaxuella thermophila TaxID=1173111 RepID=A0A1H8I8Q1_9BACL|nr:DNA double-strand break repair nuclease NurA [Lihuaxuella thermophila]SEN64525.1 NurA domain-containing protein [Lihuaxuella thermophila]